MTFTAGFEGHQRRLIDLFTAVFTASEGPDEGKLIGGLVHDLLTHTPQSDIRVFRAEEEGTLIGAAVFTRLAYPDDPHAVVLLSPVAVATDWQRKGVGQALLVHALKALRSEGFDIAITYGDPAYYQRVGFVPITEYQARAPFPLNHPHGWIGQSLSDQPMPVLAGKPICVPALNRPDIW